MNSMAGRKRMERIKNWWNQWEGLSSAAVKMIAVICMLTDHLGAGLVGRFLLRWGIWDAYWERTDQAAWIASYGSWNHLYLIMRYVGRLAFPIYCYLLVEGFHRTKSAWKYLARLLIFALISEIPFDLCLSAKVVQWENQNVFFTLAIGLGVVMLSDLIQRKLGQPVASFLLSLCVAALGALLAWVIHADYDYYGIACIFIIWLFSNRARWQRLLAGAVSFAWELPWAPFAFLILALYKGKKGKNLKYFFYAFYPAHLFLIWLISRLLGMGDQPAFNYLVGLY